MEVILKKDVDKIGKAGVVVNVKEGFARNFLFPHDLAQPVTDAILKKLEQEKSARFVLEQKIKEESLKLKEQLNKLSLIIKALIQGEDKLYGSIHTHDISLVLKEEGFDIDKNFIDLPEPIKALGVYEIPVKLHPEVIAKIKLSVIKK